MKEKKSQSKIKPSCLYYCNPLFDLSIGGYDTKSLSQAAAEMSCLFIPLATSQDRILLNISIPDEYIEHLTSSGLDCSEPLYPSEDCGGMNGVPWGWNKDAVDTLNHAGARCCNPDLSVVKTVNSRKFSFIVNQKSDTGVPGAEYFNTKEQLIQALQSGDQFPLVIKPEFGNAGYGFIRKTSAVINNTESRQLDVLFSGDRGVVVEPWYNRTADISSRCTISSDGNITGIRHHSTLSNRAGTFFADWLDPEDEVIIKWREILDKAVFNCAKELYEAGYFGPAGFDSFVWTDKQGREQLAAVIEINARHVMSSVAYALHDRLAQNRVTTFRFIGKKRHHLPDTYKAFLEVLGDDAFNSKKERGTLLVTPLRVCHGNDNWVQPARSAFFLAEETSEKLFKLDERIREILAR